MCLKVENEREDWRSLGYLRRLGGRGHLKRWGTEKGGVKMQEGQVSMILQLFEFFCLFRS